MTTNAPPGPKSSMLGFDFAQRFRNDPLGTATELHRTYGDIVYLKFGPVDYFILSHPDYVKEVFVTRAREFVKSDLFKRVIRSVDGNGLVASEGDFWLKQRRTINPTFAHERLAKYAEVIVDAAEQHLQRWKPGAVVDIAQEMTTMTLTVAAKIFLGVDVAGREDELAGAVDSISQIMYREFTDVLPMPDWLPLPSKITKRHSIALLERLIEQGIREQREKPNPGSMLTMLLQARDTEGGGATMSEEQVIAEAKTMFNAGHDSTAAALSWAWYLLLRNPEAYQRLFDETDKATNGERVSFAATQKTHFANQVAKETIRLYPPAWVLPRQVLDTTAFHGYQLPRGATINLFPWVIQRDERFFPEPERFDPDRFSPENEAKIHPFAWFPFGAGSRACIGRELALLEMQLMLMLISQKFRLEFAPEQSPDVEPNPLISLEPKNGIKVKINVR